MLNHKEICKQLNIQETVPAPTGHRPYAVKKTRVSVLVEGEVKINLGGEIVCGKCGFEIDTKQQEDFCPKCGWNGENDYLSGKIWIEEIQETFK